MSSPSSPRSSSGPSLPPAGLEPVAILIPAWQPGPALPALVEELLRLGARHILLVDDGSAPACAPLFAALAARPGVQLLRHAGNRGKGAALKSGFAHLLGCPGLRAVVTADSDGQHAPTDILRLARASLAHPGRWLLGARQFTGRGVPARSRLGNNLSRRLVRLLTGRALADTQTGLRAFPASLLPALAALPGERYDYEMAALLHLCRSAPPPLELPIQTLYFDGNRCSHFRPLRDSARVYAALLRPQRPGRLPFCPEPTT